MFFDSSLTGDHFSLLITQKKTFKITATFYTQDDMMTHVTMVTQGTTAK